MTNGYSESPARLIPDSQGVLLILLELVPK